MKYGDKDYDKYLELGEKFLKMKAPEPLKTGVIRQNGDKIDIYISNTVLKHFFYKNDKETICPKFTKHNIIDGNRTPPTDSMLKGLFFESGCIGGGSDGESVDDLPRKKNGEKTADQMRIEEQIMRFQQVYEKHGVIIIPKNKHKVKKNVQVHKVMEWTDEELQETHPEVNVFIQLTLDLLSPIKTPDFNFPVAVIDLKLTKDREGTFGRYCWGEPKWMDHIQAYLYSYLLDLPFIYWIWDYKPSDRGDKFIPVNTDTSHPNPELAAEARTRRAEMFQRIRDTVKEIYNYQFFDGWNPLPLYSICKNCPLDCDERLKTQMV